MSYASIASLDGSVFGKKDRRNILRPCTPSTIIRRRLLHQGHGYDYEWIASTISPAHVHNFNNAVFMLSLHIYFILTALLLELYIWRLCFPSRRQLSTSALALSICISWLFSSRGIFFWRLVRSMERAEAWLMLLIFAHICIIIHNKLCTLLIKSAGNKWP